MASWSSPFAPAFAEGLCRFCTQNLYKYWFFDVLARTKGDEIVTLFLTLKFATDPWRLEVKRDLHRGLCALCFAAIFRAAEINAKARAPRSSSPGRIVQIILCRILRPAADLLHVDQLAFDPTDPPHLYVCCVGG